MPYVSNTILDRGSSAIKELIGERAYEMVRTGDPVFRNLILDPATELSGAEFGRDNYIRKTYNNTCVQGVIEGINQRNFMPLEGTVTQAQGNKMYNYSGQTIQEWTDGLNGPNPRQYRLTIPVYGMMGDLVFTLEESRLDATAANIKKYIMPKLNGFARNFARWVENSFYANRGNNFRLGTLGLQSGGSPTVVAAAVGVRTITFQPTEGTVYRYEMGMGVDVYNSANTRLNEVGGTRHNVFVASVDPWTNTVVLQVETNTTVLSDANYTAQYITGNPLDSGYITYANIASGGTFQGIAGWRDWLKTGNPSSAAADRRLLGAAALADGIIDVSEQTEFKSGRFPSFGLVTEMKMAAAMQRTHAAFDPLGYRIDDLIGAQGIWLSMYSQLEHRQRFERGNTKPGSLGPAGAQSEDQVLNVDGRVYPLRTSHMLESGLILGLRTKGNWAMAVPPDPANVRSLGNRDQTTSPKIPIKTVIPALLGLPTDRFPRLQNNGIGITEFSRMPVYSILQIMPTEQIPGVIFEGCTDLRSYSTPA